jgi:two-component system, NarL family, nitrate/nitrite response regulator NarL
VVLPQKLLTKLSDKPGIVDGRSNETEGGSSRLSNRERAVLIAMADGLSNKEIGRRLGISFHTVKFHVASILEKLEVDTRTEAVIKAAQLGLVML